VAQNGTRMSGMRKPKLRITENIGGIPTKGTCSSCQGVVFSTSAFLGSKADNQAALDLNAAFGQRTNATSLETPYANDLFIANCDLSNSCKNEQF